MGRMSLKSFKSYDIDLDNCGKESELIKYLVFDRYLSELVSNKLYLKKRLYDFINSKPDRFIINLIRSKTLLEYQQFDDHINKSSTFLKPISKTSSTNSAQSIDQFAECSSSTDFNGSQQLFQAVLGSHYDLYYGDIHSKSDISSVDSCDVDDLLSQNSVGMNSLNQFSLNVQNEIQTEIIRQANLVLKLSKKQKNSRYEIETERIILLASLKRNAIVYEINNFNSDVENDSLNDNIVFVHLCDMSLKRSAKYINFSENTTYTFVIVAAHKTTILGTKLLELDDRLHKSVEIPNDFLFDNISTEFDISLQIFFVREVVDLEVKGQHNCLPIKKLFKKEPVFVEKKLSFSKCYHISIRKDTLCQSRKVFFSVDEQMEIQFKFNLEFKIKKCGFITTSFNQLQDWNRYWCVLRNHELHFWLYPNDENLKPAFRIINLSEFQKIEKANRNSCPRNYSLLLKKRNYNLFLKTDNFDQLEHWFDILCYVLSIAKSLNVSHT